VEKAYSYKMSAIIYQSIWHNIAEELNLQKWIYPSQNSLCGISLPNFSRMWEEGLVNCFTTLFWLHSSWRIVYWERGNGRWSLSQISSNFLIKFS